MRARTAGALAVGIVFLPFFAAGQAAVSSPQTQARRYAGRKCAPSLTPSEQTDSVNDGEALRIEMPYVED